MYNDRIIYICCNINFSSSFRNFKMHCFPISPPTPTDNWYWRLLLEHSGLQKTVDISKAKPAAKANYFPQYYHISFMKNLLYIDPDQLAITMTV